MRVSIGLGFPAGESQEEGRATPCAGPVIAFWCYSGLDRGRQKLARALCSLSGPRWVTYVESKALYMRKLGVGLVRRDVASLEH
jgi:hypothetical protein